jgi:hypothetical protein
MSNPILCLKSSRMELVVAEESVLVDLPQALPAFTVNVNGTMMTQPQVLAQVRGHLDLMAEVEAARKHLEALIAAEKAAHAELKVTMECVRHVAIAILGANSEPVALLGFATKPRTPPSIETLTAAVAKRLATRKLRNTMGKRQRAALRASAIPAPQTGEPGPAVAIDAHASTQQLRTNAKTSAST